MGKASKEADHKGQSEAHIFCLSVSTWPKWLILLIGSSGIFCSFLLHGIAHENLIKNFKLTETFFLTFFQFVGYSMFSLSTFVSILFKRHELKAPIRVYITTSIALAFSMGLTNFATSRLSYATSVLFKSSKLIPVMIGNIIFLKKKPKVSEAIAVVLIVMGLIGISLGDFRGKNKFDIPGIVSISMSLVAGAVASNLEEKVMSIYGASQNELISMLYTIGALIMLFLGLITGQFESGIEKVANKPKSLLFLAFFAFLGAAGIQFVYLIMKVFGSLTTVMITSVRKALTVVLSFLIFKDKVFTVWHAFSVVMITVGMSLSMYNKFAGKKEKNEGENVEDDDDLQGLLNKDDQLNDNESPVNFSLVSTSSSNQELNEQ